MNIKNIPYWLLYGTAYLNSKDTLDGTIYFNAYDAAEKCIENVGGQTYSFYPNIGIDGYYNDIDFSPVYNLYNSGLIGGLGYKILSSILYLANKNKNNNYANKIGINSAICGGFVDIAYTTSLFKLPITINGTPLEEYIINSPKAVNISGMINAQKAAFIISIICDIGLVGYGIKKLIQKNNTLKIKNYKRIKNKINL